jgi:CheY-like chemotaxis protein
LATIADESNRGAILARQLVDLSRPTDPEPASVDLGEILSRAAIMLKKTAKAPVEIVADQARTSFFPEMPADQLEQLVIRFGLQVADEYEEPMSLHLLLRRFPDKSGESVHDARPALVYLVACHHGEAPDIDAYRPDTSPPLSRDGGGAVQSVVLSLLERHGGALDVLVNDQGYHAYCIALAAAHTPEVEKAPTEPDRLQLEGRRVLLARPAINSGVRIQGMLEELGATVIVTNNTVGALNQMVSEGPFAFVVLDQTLLGMDPAGMLDRFTQHNGGTGIVVLQPHGPRQQRPPRAGRIARPRNPTRHRTRYPTRYHTRTRPNIEYGAEYDREYRGENGERTLVFD